jgi:hypothetical protein
MALETAVVLLESVLPSLLDPAVLDGQAPGFKDSMVGLLQPLLALRYTDPVMVALVSDSSTVSWLVGRLITVSEGWHEWACCSRCWRCATLTL